MSERAPRECHDCGCDSQWWFLAEDHPNMPSLCRSCYSRGGYPVHVEIDPDKLAALVGKELALKIANECKRDW